MESHVDTAHHVQRIAEQGYTIVQDAIERHLPADQFEVLKAAEESERKIIRRLVNKVAS